MHSIENQKELRSVLFLGYVSLAFASFSSLAPFFFFCVSETHQKFILAPVFQYSF